MIVPAWALKMKLVMKREAQRPESEREGHRLFKYISSARLVSSKAGSCLAKKWIPSLSLSLSLTHTEGRKCVSDTWHSRSSSLPTAALALPFHASMNTQHNENSGVNCNKRLLASSSCSVFCALQQAESLTNKYILMRGSKIWFWSI